MFRKLLSIVAIMPCLTVLALAQTVLYPAVPGMRTSEVYSISVNGQESWVEAVGPGGMEDLHTLNLSAEGSQTFVISVDEDIESYSIQPKSYGIKGVAEGKTLTVTLDCPMKLYIRINELPYLAIFSNPLEKDAPSKQDRNVDYYGPGNHDVGEIQVRDGQNIYISGGANVNGRLTGTAKDVTICGRGSFTGNARLNDCENLRVEGIYMRNTRGWANTITNSVNTSYDNVKIFSHTGVWGLDGINPVSCKGFDINDCFIRTRDDCIAIKSNGDPQKFDLSSRDITIRNSTMIGWDHADGVTLGFELNGGVVENIRVTNCDILSARGSGRTGGHAAFSIVCDGESQVKDIYFEDIRVEAAIEYKNLEIILTEAERYGNGRMGSISGVYLKNVSWENAFKPFTIVGHPTRYVENVVFTNCYVGGKLLTGVEDADFQMEFTRDIMFVPGGKVEYERYPEQDGEIKTRVSGQRRIQR